MAFCKACLKKGNLRVLEEGKCPDCGTPAPIPTKKPAKPKNLPITSTQAKFAKRKLVGKSGGKCKPKKLKVVELVEVVSVQTRARMVDRTVGGATDPSVKRPQFTTRTDKLTADGRDHYKQYVNLPKRLVPSGARHPEYGRYIRLMARVEWEDSSCKDSLAKKKVEWRLSHDAVNGRPSDLKPREKEGFNRAGGSDCVVTFTVASGWTPSVKVFLSSYGGDKFWVDARADTNGKGRWSPDKTTKRYQVWRKLWYQVTEMKHHTSGKLGLPAAVTTALENGYNTVFIEFEEKGPRKLINHIGHISDHMKEAKKHFVKDNLCPIVFGTQIA